MCRSIRLSYKDAKIITFVLLVGRSLPTLINRGWCGGGVGVVWGRCGVVLGWCGCGVGVVWGWGGGEVVCDWKQTRGKQYRVTTQ